MTSPLREFQIHLGAAARNRKKILDARAGLSHLEYLPIGPCGRTYDGNDACTLAEDHKGPCNIRRIGEIGEEE